MSRWRRLGATCWSGFWRVLETWGIATGGRLDGAPFSRLACIALTSSAQNVNCCSQGVRDLHRDAVCGAAGRDAARHAGAPARLHGRQGRLPDERAGGGRRHRPLRHVSHVLPLEACRTGRVCGWPPALAAWPREHTMVLHACHATHAWLAGWLACWLVNCLLFCPSPACAAGM